MAQVSCDSPILGVKLMPVDEALQRLSECVVPVSETEEIALSDGLGRVLAEAITSPLNVPPLANSSMDGYAVRADEIHEGIQLPVSQRIPAGSVGSALLEGTIARIFTGAPVPEGADAVVMQELCEVGADGVTISASIDKGENIRAAGEDIKQGELVLSAHHKLRAQDLGLLASVGVCRIRVYKRLRVAVFFTGDELREPGEVLAEGQIYNSNRYTLVGMLQRMGCEVVNLGIIQDDLASTIDALNDASSQADLVMTSGGVSVGEEDHVKSAVDSLGALDLWRISIKPGKPLAFGEVNGVPFLGLPGNPVSVFATTCVLARPFILAMQGGEFESVKGFNVTANFDLAYTVRRQEYLRVRLVVAENGKAVLESYPNQSSGVLTSASWADGLAVVREGVKLSKGDELEFIPFSLFDL